MTPAEQDEATKLLLELIAKHQPAARNWFSTSCLIAVGVSVLGTAWFTAKAAIAGSPVGALLLIVLGIVLGVYYMIIFYWSLGHKILSE